MNIIQETDCNQIEKRLFIYFLCPPASSIFFFRSPPFFFFIWGATQTFTFFLDDEKKATLISQVVQKESEEWSSAVQFDTPLVILNLFHCGVRNIYPSTQILKIELATQKQKQNNFPSGFLSTHSKNLAFSKSAFHKKKILKEPWWMCLVGWCSKCENAIVFLFSFE